MKMIGNCRFYGEYADCPFLRFPAFHSGYTSKSGKETWFHCVKHEKPIRHIKFCNLAGDPDKQKEVWIEDQANQPLDSDTKSSSD